MIQYKLDAEEQKENDKKVRNVKTLLPKWVGPAIRGKLEEFNDPKDAWEYLRGLTESSSSAPDPWDWTVVHVVFTLTDPDSPLLSANIHLLLPDLTIIRKQDPNQQVSAPAKRPERGTFRLANQTVALDSNHDPPSEQQTQRSANPPATKIYSKLTNINASATIPNGITDEIHKQAYMEGSTGCL